jgi:hypothetical protein
MGTPDENNNSPHILNTSSNLLGLCFIVLTSIHVLNLKHTTIIDELTAATIFFLMISSLLSFLSLQSKSKRGSVYEKYAGKFFLGGLLLMFAIILMIVFGIID